MPPSTETRPSTGLDWRRPHPLTIVVEIGSALRQVLLALAVVGFRVIEVGSLIELALVVGPLGGALARWYTTRYAVDAEALHYHHGLIWRRRQVLPRANIQNVSTTAGIVARLGSVVELHVSDASSNGDVKLRFVSKADAERLTTLLRSRPSDGLGPSPSLGPAPDGAPVERLPLVQPGLGRLAWYEVTSIRFVTTVSAALTAAAVGSVVLLLPRGPGPELRAHQGAMPWLVLAAAVAVLLLAAGVGLTSRLVALGGYRLQAEPDRLRIQVGLLTEARITARRERIQQLRVDRDLLQRRLGQERVRFETADVDVASSVGTRYLDPCAPAGAWRPLAVEVFGRLDHDEPDLAPVSPLTRRRTMARFGFGALPALGLWWLHPALALTAVAVVLAVGWWYSRRRYRELGWALSLDQLLVRTGVVQGQLRLVDLDKVQNVRLSATYLQRRLGLATFQVTTAGHGLAGLVRLPDLEAGRAEELLARVAHRAATTQVSRTL